MPKTYSVKVANNREFSRLVQSDDRYKFVDETNLGFTDPEKNVAYVRYTAWPELNKYLVTHEFEHLLNPENGVDRDPNGIYHKKFFKDVVTRVLPFAAAFLPPPFNLAAVPAATAAGGAIRGEKGLGKQALISTALTAGGNVLGGGSVFGGKGVAGIPGQVGQVLGKTPSGTPTAVQGTSSSSQSPGLLSRIFSKIKSFLPFGSGSPVPPPGGQAASDVLERQIASGGFGGGKFNLNQLQQLLPQFSTPAAQAGGAFSPFKIGAGLALAGAGQLFGKAPQIPSFNTPSVQQLRSTAGQPISEVAKSATARLKERLAQTGKSALVTPEIQTIENDIRETFARQRDALYSQYQTYYPGADLANNSSFQRANAELARQEAASVANVRQQELGRFESRQTQDISAALGVDTQTLNQLMDLANLDISEIMAKTGLKAQEAQDFRQMMGQLGAILVSSGSGLNSFSPFNLGR